jgi:hypothetical protein
MRAYQLASGNEAQKYSDEIQIDQKVSTISEDNDECLWKNERSESRSTSYF